MTKMCADCGKVEIDDKYVVCASCNNKSKKINGDPMIDVVKVLKEMQETMKFINWNLGALRCIASKDKKTLKKIDKDIKEAHDGQQGQQ